jgi:hypothetical protein
MRRRQAVVLGHPGLGAEVFEIDPDRRRRLLAHRGQIGVRQGAAEGFDHHPRRRGCCKRRTPGADRHPLAGLLLRARVDHRPDALKHVQIVDP